GAVVGGRWREVYRGADGVLYENSAARPRFFSDAATVESIREAAPAEFTMRVNARAGATVLSSEGMGPGRRGVGNGREGEGWGGGRFSRSKFRRVSQLCAWSIGRCAIGARYSRLASRRFCSGSVSAE